MWGEAPMPADRLNALDIAFLCLDDADTPMHMGAVATFAQTGPVDGHRVAALVAERAARIPRLRMRVRTDRPPSMGASWEPDPTFDAGDHVGVGRLDGTAEADPIAGIASRWMATRLCTDSPLWAARVVTGLPDGGFALLLKLHHALTDGTGAARLALDLLDPPPTPRSRAERPPTPPAASPRSGRTPGTFWNEARLALGRVAESASIVTAMARAARPCPPAATVTGNSARRRVGLVRLDLADIRVIRRAHGGTTNDVVLALVAGALREWRINNGKRPGTRGLRALVPVSVRGRAEASAEGNTLSGYLCELPVGTDDPVTRLSRVRATMERNKKAGPTRGAGAFPVLAGKLPTGLHRMATKTVGRTAPLFFDTVVTSVPIPGLAASFDGAPLREVYPLAPLAPQQALGVAVSSYRDTLHIGLQVNGDTIPDVGSLTDAVRKSLSALYERSLGPDGHGPGH